MASQITQTFSLAAIDLDDNHNHRRPRRKDFEGKTIKKFRRTADNIWRFWFTDGTAFAIQSENFGGLACMELCDECVDG